jgi:NTP pyrophosphatase (non-canonical NTP hydrolase)
VNVKKIIERIRRIEEERNWVKFHNAKELAIDISVEASELLELFLWKSSEDVLRDKKKRVKEELADVLISCLNLADKLGLNVEEMIDKKLNEIERKYPSGKFKGRAEKYDEL